MDPEDAVTDVVRVALMSAASHETAVSIVTTLVEERVIACGNILPGVTSIYRWQGAVQTEPEVMVVLKTTDDKVSALLERVRALHPYDVPELLVLTVESGHEPYLKWVAESVGTGNSES